MKPTTRRFLVALAVCALVPVVGAGAKQNPVERPFKMSAQSQMVVTVCATFPLGCPYEAHAWGVASHLGKFTAEEQGTLSLVNGGTMTAANGDLLYYTQPLGSLVVTITGGTGRFAGASGELVITILEQTGPVPDSGTLVTELTWTASGYIVY